MRRTARQTGNLRLRPAFTLVELLVVMGVLAMMASMVLVGLASAAEQARAARTRSQVQKIHELLMTRWEEYRYRRVEPATTGNVRARQTDRLDKIRELMRMEMPDRKEDFGYMDGGTLNSAPTSLSTPPSLWLRYQRAIMRRTGHPNDWEAAFGAWSGLHANAECLYMILESIQDGDTNGLDFFKASEIGDTDGDGMPEILDGWGNPIVFLRWPYGFPRIETTGDVRTALSNLHDLSAPDPFDPLNVRGGRTTLSTTPLVYDHYALYPLVCSAGPDGLYNLRMAIEDFGGTNVPLAYQSLTPPNNPYAETTISGNQIRIGQILDDSGDELDNITNHVLVIGGND